jgi:hypothetical protein
MDSLYSVPKIQAHQGTLDASMFGQSPVKGLTSWQTVLLLP